MTELALLLAAVLLGAIGLTHSWLGEAKLIGPLLAPGRRHGLLEKSGFARATLRFAWHLTTIAWWGFAAILLVAARRPLDGRAVLLATAATFIASGVITLVATRGRHLAWPVFLAVGALALVPLY